MKTIIFSFFILLSFNAFCQKEDLLPPLPLEEQIKLEKENLARSSKTWINIRNNTSKAISMAYVAYDKSEESWTSHGWYRIEAYKVVSLPLGDYKGPVYIHGHNERYTWGSTNSFCIDPGKAFEILFSDRGKCETKYKFDKVNCNTGENKYTFNQ